MAFQHAIARQGAAVVELAGDISEEDTGLRSLLPHSFEFDPPVCAPAERDLDAVAELIDRHEKVTIYCGAGVRNAHAEVTRTRGADQGPRRLHAAGVSSGSSTTTRTPSG